MHGILYYGKGKVEEVFEIEQCRELRIYRKDHCLDVSGHDAMSPIYKQGDAVIWWPKKEPGYFNRALNQVWHLERLINPIDKYDYSYNRFYIEDYRHEFYLCYKDNNTMFLSKNASDKKIIFEYNKKLNRLS